MTPRTLSELKLDPIVFPVTDDLAGLERLLPDAPDAIERFAILAGQTPSILDIRGRAVTHEMQMDRLVALAGNDPVGLEARVDTANALAILAHAGQIAQMLVPARTEQDRWAQAEVARERKRIAGRSKSRRDAALLRRACSGAPPRIKEHRLASPTALSDTVHAMARFVGAILPEPTDDRGARIGEPGAYRLEDAHSLEAYFAEPPNLAELVAAADALLERSDGWSRADHPAGMVDDAVRAAQMLAYARLARAGLWPARSAGDLQAKAEAGAIIARRRTDPDHLRALVLLALDVGHIIARQSDRFSSNSAIEL